MQSWRGRRAHLDTASGTWAPPPCLGLPRRESGEPTAPTFVDRDEQKPIVGKAEAVDIGAGFEGQGPGCVAVSQGECVMECVMMECEMMECVMMECVMMECVMG